TDLGQLSGRADSRWRQLDVLQRRRGLDLAEHEAEVLGDGVSRRAQRLRRRLLVLIAPSPMLEATDVHARESMLVSLCAGARDVAAGHAQMHGSTDQTATEQPEILARGPWELDRIQASWRDEQF